MDYKAFYLIKEGYGDYTNNQANWTSISKLIKGKSNRCNRFKTEEEAKSIAWDDYIDRAMRMFK